jgi:O-antigen/teichoic acid export membrane protein
MGRAAWSIADQATCSLGNIAVTILVARSLPAKDFGSYGLAFAMYLLVLGVSRSFATEPFAVRFAAVDPADSESVGRTAVGTAFVVGVAAGVVLLPFALVLHARAPIVAVALTLPCLMVQDAWRFVAVTLGRPREALLNDLVWSISSVALVFFLTRRTGGSPTIYFAAWAGTAALGAFVAALRLGGAPRIWQSGRWLRDNLDLSLRFTVQFVLQTGSTQLLIFFIALVGGLAEVGGVNAAQALVGPVNLIIMGTTIAILPELARLSHGPQQDFRRVVRAVSWSLATVAMLWGLVAALLPTSVGRVLFGSSWTYARPLLLPVILVSTAGAALQAPAVALRALGAAGSAVRVSAAVAPVLLAAGITGAALGGARGALFGWALGSTWALVLWWRMLARTLARSEVESRETRTPSNEAELVAR